MLQGDTGALREGATMISQYDRLSYQTRTIHGPQDILYVQPPTRLNVSPAAYL